MNREVRARLYDFAASLMQPIKFPEDPQDIGSAPPTAPSEQLDLLGDRGRSPAKRTTPK